MQVGQASALKNGAKNETFAIGAYIKFCILLIGRILVALNVDVVLVFSEGIFANFAEATRTTTNYGCVAMLSCGF
jgi:hypothetical protein